MLILLVDLHASLGLNDWPIGWVISRVASLHGSLTVSSHELWTLRPSQILLVVLGSEIFLKPVDQNLEGEMVLVVE